jgi:hypothetical protein
MRHLNIFISLAGAFTFLALVISHTQNFRAHMKPKGKKHYSASEYKRARRGVPIGTPFFYSHYAVTSQKNRERNRKK